MKFLLKNQDNEICQIPDPDSKYTVLFFYPKDNTPGCSAEVSEISQLRAEFESLHAKVYGVSSLDIKSKKKFAEKTNCGFSLLADDDFTVAKQFGFYKQKSFLGKKYMGIERSTVVLDNSGKIIHTFQNVKPKGHAKQVLEYLKNPQVHNE